MLDHRAVNDETVRTNDVLNCSSGTPLRTSADVCQLDDDDDDDDDDDLLTVTC